MIETFVKRHYVQGSAHAKKDWLRTFKEEYTIAMHADTCQMNRKVSEKAEGNKRLTLFNFLIVEKQVNAQILSKWSSVISSNKQTRVNGRIKQFQKVHLDFTDWCKAFNCPDYARKWMW